MTKYQKFVPKITKEEFDATSPHYCKCGCAEIIEWKPWYNNRGIPKYKHGHHGRKYLTNIWLPLILCACGCGRYIPLIGENQKRHPSKYIIGHNNKGKKFSKYPENHPIYICQCGCGQVIPWKKWHWWHPPKFFGWHGFKKSYGHSKGKPCSEKTKKILSERNRGNTPWNKGMKMSRYICDKISKSNNGKKRSLEFSKKMSAIHKNKKVKEETKKKLMEYYGPRASGWKGGISKQRYCHKFNKNLKNAVRHRDKYTCQLCGLSENGTKHSVHHIHYDKTNCYPDLIYLCRSCNSKVNFNRDFYEKLLMNKLNERGILFWTKAHC